MVPVHFHRVKMREDKMVSAHFHVVKMDFGSRTLFRFGSFRDDRVGGGPCTLPLGESAMIKKTMDFVHFNYYEHTTVQPKNIYLCFVLVPVFTTHFDFYLFIFCDFCLGVVG